MKLLTTPRFLADLHADACDLERDQHEDARVGVPGKSSPLPAFRAEMRARGLDWSAPWWKHTWAPALLEAELLYAGMP